MELSREQQLAVDKVGHWFERGTDQVFHVFGYAGTGKTTIARYFAEMIGGNVMFGAYTGKAAHVLQTKGCFGASTIHSMIYHGKDKGQATLLALETELTELIKELVSSGLPEKHFMDHKRYAELTRNIEQEKKNLLQPTFVLNMLSDVKDADLVIIDECSMVDAQMGQDLLSFGTPVLVLGDPAQLPPVGGAGYFTERVTPDIMLTEIHRQAAESPIIRLATKVRNNEFLEVGKYGNCEVVAKGERLDPERVLAFNQVLVGKNVTRFASNMRMRKLLGHEDPMPVQGDRLVCLRNNHEVGVLNGAIFNVLDVEGVLDEKVHMTVVSDDNPEKPPIQLGAHMHHFIGKGKDIPFYDRKDAEEFDYGYALTVHKSQGSQWNDVLVFDESWCFKADRHRWLYTAITRAAESVTVAKM